MLLLLNKTIKPLNQFAKENPKELCFWGYCWWFSLPCLTKYFRKKSFFCYTHVFMNPSFMQSIRKRNNPFWIYSTDNRQSWQQHLQRKAHNIGKRYNNNFNTANKCSRLIIAINTTGITKYKPSIIYKKITKTSFNFHVPLHPFYCAKL